MSDKPVVLIAEELSPATIEELGPDFEVRFCNGSDRADLLAAIPEADALLVRSATTYVEANYKETDLANMYVGQPAEIQLDAYPGVRIRGHFASIGWDRVWAPIVAPGSAASARSSSQSRHSRVASAAGSIPAASVRSATGARRRSSGPSRNSQ